MSSDPYKYYRIEARELLQGLSQGVLELEKGSPGKDLVGRLLRLAHTLKGASRVVKETAVGDLAHSLEGALGQVRELAGRVPRQRIDELLKFLDGISTRIAALDPAGDPGRPAASRASGDERIEAVRVDLGEMDALMESLIETGAKVAGFERDILELDAAFRAADRLAERFSRAGADGKESLLASELRATLGGARRNLEVRIDQVSRELAQARELADGLRLLPAGALFAPLERAVRDAAQLLRKRVEFHPTGGETRLDGHVLGALRDALLHAVRNAVAHGIETEDRRIAAGKAPAGSIEIRVERRGNRVTFLCRDDGRGVDVEAVRRSALEKGLISARDAGSLGAEDAVRLILRGGVSTKGSADEVSGRGIGLDVVRETVARLKGEVALQSTAGRGTELSLTVPVSLSSVPAIVVEAGTVTAALPLDAVESTRRLQESDIARSPEGDSILHRGRAIPLIPLSRALGAEPAGGGSRGPRSALVVRAGEDQAAVTVDRILGSSTVVVRHLPAWVAADPVVAGGALDLGGSPQIVLEPHALVQAARASAGKTEDPPAQRPPLLVVDDSLTTRMLEKSILESAGFEVDLAVSAEEALAKARSRRYGLFIVDVEMPGMDGFQFISETRSDAALRAVPSILVTSRASAEDRRKGEQVGASAYVVKSEFDQGRLLDIIRNLSG